MNLIRLSVLALGLASYASGISFPSGLIPFTSIYYVTPPDANGNRLVVGNASFTAFEAISSLPAPSFQDELFNDSTIELAPGQFFQSVYVPTSAERSGDFSDFGGPIIDPRTGLPFPGNIIPMALLPDPFAFQIGPAPNTAPLQFVPVTPCRVADTRNPSEPFGGPILSAQSTRNYPIPGSSCGIPSTAQAYALNVTVIPSGPLRFMTVWPNGQSQPTASTLNSYDGRIKANAAIVPAGVNGAIAVFATDDTHLVLDISGYFVPAPDAAALAFYPLAPCRVADTRDAIGPLGGPSMAVNDTRTFPVLSSACNTAAVAQAYSLNITVVPKEPLAWLSAWPAGQPYPGVSALNAPTGTVVANAAIVPAGTNGDMSIFVTNNTDVIVDINGYFAPPATGGLSLYNVTPCRVLDTRDMPGAPLIGTMALDVPNNSCNLPSARAYVFNATVIPSTALKWLTLWPSGDPQASVSTLNAYDGSVTSNMAVVPAASGSLDAFTTDAAHLILDAFGYFAP